MTVNSENINVLARDIEKVLFTQADLDIIVGNVAKKITDRYSEKVLKENEKLVILAVLNGSFQFVADLVKKLTFRFKWSSCLHHLMGIERNHQEKSTSA